VDQTANKFIRERSVGLDYIPFPTYLYFVMDTKLSLSIILTIGAFVLTLYLFVVAAIAHDELNTSEYLGCGTTTASAKSSPEVKLDHPGAQLFRANCKACHAIDRKLIGPALAGATDRYDSVWLTAWIRNSSKMIADGDPMAVALFKEYNKTQMTSFTSFTDQEMKDLLDYLRLLSQVPKATPSAAKVQV
jgi:mono/diheme cytochrome c family protein